MAVMGRGLAAGVWVVPDYLAFSENDISGRPHQELRVIASGALRLIATGTREADHLEFSVNDKYLRNRSSLLHT
jgi:hypothetical protein